MPDPYRLSPQSPPEDRSLLRPVLWVVLVLSAAANAVASSALDRPLAGVVFGVVTLACAVALVLDHYRRR